MRIRPPATWSPRSGPPLALAAVALLAVTGATGAEPERIDPDTGAATWEMRHAGVTLSLTQLLPDQILAFYVNRGFDLADAEIFADACVYMAVMRNEAAPGPISFRQADWAIQGEDGARPIPPLEDWLARWEGRDVPRPARIAFRWAQLPPAQHYAPGEWNQGMLATGLAPGARFDLITRWTLAGETHEGRLQDVRCVD